MPFSRLSARRNNGLGWRQKAPLELTNQGASPFAQQAAFPLPLAEG